MKKRQILDVLMTVLFLVQMAYHIEGNFLHEVLGVCLFVLFVIHNVWNRQWYASLFKGKYSSLRILMTGVNLSFLVCIALIMISGLMISRDLFRFFPFYAGMLGRRLHMCSSVWGYIFMAMHLGLHWGLMARHLPKRWRENPWVEKLVLGILILVGVHALFSRQILVRMFLMIDYVFFDFQEMPLLFFIDYLCLLVLFGAISYKASNVLRIRKGGSRS